MFLTRPLDRALTSNAKQIVACANGGKKMSYMENEIQTMSFDEIEEVDGGLLALAVALAIAGGVMYMGWRAAHNKAEAAE